MHVQYICFRFAVSFDPRMMEVLSAHSIHCLTTYIRSTLFLVVRYGRMVVYAVIRPWVGFQLGMQLAATWVDPQAAPVARHLIVPTILKLTFVLRHPPPRPQ
jgi:hypothetical protein